MSNVKIFSTSPKYKEIAYVTEIVAINIPIEKIVWGVSVQRFSGVYVNCDVFEENRKFLIYTS